MALKQSLEEAADLIIKVACPVLWVLGGFGNVMTIIVFRRLRDYAAMRTFYIALALTNLLSLTFGFLTHYWLKYQFHFFIFCMPTIICKVITAVHFMSRALSSWYLVVMTMQRAIAVLWPHHVNVVCTRNVSRVVTVLMAVVIVSLYSHILYGFSASTPPCHNSSCGECYCTPFGEGYRFFFNQIWSWIDLLVGSLVPFVLLLVSNIALLKAVITSAKNVRHRLTIGQSMQVTARESKAFSLSVTLIGLSLSFFVLTGPFRAHLIFTSYITLKGFDYEINNLVFVLLYTLCISNSVVNFYLYCLTGLKFRKEVVRLVCAVFNKITRL